VRAQSKAFVNNSETAQLNSTVRREIATVQPSMATKTSRPDFESIFPSLVEDLKEAAGRYKLPQNAMDWFVKVRSA
jgi:hypothetical protein